MKKALNLIGIIVLFSNLALPVNAPVKAQGLMLLPGQIAHDRVNKLTSNINWYSSLYQAEESARSQGKMVLWLHMLGNLKGET